MSHEKLIEKLRRIASADSYWSDNSWLKLISKEERNGLSDIELEQQKNTLKAESDYHDALPRIEAIRTKMKEQGLDYYIVTREDEFNNEYAPKCNERLAFATGFTGSAGFAIIGHDNVTLFTDSRYTIQSRDECPDAFFIHEPFNAQALEGWIKAHLKAGEKIGFDPKLTSYNTERTLYNGAKEKQAHSIECETSPLDEAWEKLGRPPQPLSPIFILDEKYTGRSVSQKKKLLEKALKEEECTVTILNDLPAIAYLLNLRGRDLDCAPLFLSYLIFDNGKATLFIDKEKLTSDVKNYLIDNQIDVKEINRFYDEVAKIKDKKVWLDPSAAPVKIKMALSGQNNDITYKLNPIDPIKSVKTEAEQNGAIKAHEIDGLALVKFLHWLETQAQDGSKTELDAVAQLEKFRQESPDYKDPSFDTISGSGSNGAIVHYRSTPKTNKVLEKNSLYLCDSGGQYFYGTTDVTRTIAIGTPTDEMRDRYTRVLQGHIRVAMTTMDKNTKGEDLDTKARSALKEVGLNFGHGVGHGVGSYLSVHEGPCGIHKGFKKPYEEGMIVSNEPGYYKDGEYGIRIENLVLVKNTQDGQKMTFKNLTLAPMDRQLIKEEMLSPDEKEWLNSYHKHVYDTLSPSLPKDVASWLKEQTKPIELKKPSSVQTLKP